VDTLAVSDMVVVGRKSRGMKFGGGIESCIYLEVEREMVSIKYRYA